jgi:hypothetical protein
MNSTIMLLRQTRVGSASSPQKRASNLRWRTLIFWLGKAVRLTFSRRTVNRFIPVQVDCNLPVSGGAST